MRDFKVDSQGNAETASFGDNMSFQAQGQSQDSEGPGQRPDAGFAADQGRQPGFGLQGEGAGGSRSGSGSDLNYIDDDPDSYQTIWENSISKSTDADHSRVVTALKTSAVMMFLPVPLNAIWMLITFCATWQFTTLL